VNRLWAELRAPEFAELTAETIAILPVGSAEVREMLGELKGAKLLQGFRGAPPAALDRLCAVIVAIGEAALALGPGLAALEVNPLWVRGEAVECLDALAVYQED